MTSALEIYRSLEESEKGTVKCSMLTARDENYTDQWPLLDFNFRLWRTFETCSQCFTRLSYLTST